MTSGLINLLSVLAIGPLFCLLALGLTAASVVILSLLQKLQWCVGLLQVSKAELRQTPVYCFACGLITTLFALFFVFAVLFHHHQLQLLGILILTALAFCLSGGAILAADHLGERIVTSFPLASNWQNKVNLGFITLTLSSLVPVLGWIVTTIAILTGTGALLKRIFTKDRP